MFTIRNSKIRKHLWPLYALMGILLTGPFSLAVCAQIVHAAVTAKAAKVSIANFAFAPAEITIAPGESVTWTNDDGAPHGLEYHDGAKGTDLLLPGASFTRQFDRPGTDDYHCSVHPYMTGRVVVRAQ
jgi:plastocyanin